METETQPAYSVENLVKPASIPEDSGTEEDMAPQERNSEMMNRQNGGTGEHYEMTPGGYKLSKQQQRPLTSDDGEDGEILEDGEIASDEGEAAADDGEVVEEDEGGKPQISSPTKKNHKEERERHGRNKRDKHSKRRRSKEDGRRDKQQKKKRYHEYVDYDKAGEEEPPWSPEKREKGDRKGERSPPAPHHSPGHDSHGEERVKHDKDGEKSRRESGDKRHHGSGRDRGRNRDKDRNRDSRDRSRDRHDKDKKERPEKDKKDRDRHKDGREKEFGKSYQHSDGYESPPGIYDSPSDDEYDRFGVKKPKTMMSLVEGDYMDPALAGNEAEVMPPKATKKMLKKKEWQERVRQRERDREFDEEQPVKKKPLLMTPMEERPVCKFFKEGKCQKGNNCLFKHDYKELMNKRLELCRYYLKSYCRQEDECPFMHSEFPCKYFHTGSRCFQGDNCKFSHDPLTPETDEALRNALNDMEVDEHFEGGFEHKKHKKKGLLGDQPAMSEEEIHRKLEHMKKIPSIFDIETFAPGVSPSKPPKPQQPQGGPGGPMMGQSPSGNRPQGFYQDSNMSPQNGPNMRFNGPPPNQGPPPQHFMQGQGGPGMDGPPPGMQGGPMGGQGMMGQGPPPPMGPHGPGMQGPPMGPPPMNNPPMSQAAALVGVLLRAAPMLQQFRGPSNQGPPTSMASNDPRFMGQPQQAGMGPNPNMMTGPPPNMTQGPPPLLSTISSPGQEGMMSPGQQGMMGNQGQEGDGPDALQQHGLNQAPGMPANRRDPRQNMAPQNDPRRNREMEGQKHQDVDMRAAREGPESMGDVDLRQDVDMRQEDNGNNMNQGNTTPQQDWDEDAENKGDDSDIPAHLPPKQREMFLRIRQHTMKLNAQKAEEAKMLEQRETTPVPKADDDKWYSSDEEDESKPDLSNILKNLNQNEIKQASVSVGMALSVPSSSINVMQMINAIKSSTASDVTTHTSTRKVDPRLQERPREPTIIISQEDDCPWRLFKVLYTRQRIPQNVDLNDPKYKNDPRVQKILKLQELESGVVIDHSKPTVAVKSENSIKVEQKPNLLDPNFLQILPALPRPELPLFVDPRASKSENVDPRVKQEPQVARQQDPRMKQGMDIKPSDPRAPKMATHNLPVKQMDPRLSRQDSNSANTLGRATDPRLSRQMSREPEVSGSCTPPMDPRQFNRQSSNDPRLQASGDPRLQSSSDPRFSPSSDPRLQPSGDPRFQSSGDPRLQPSGDPRLQTFGDLRSQSSPDSRLQRTESTPSNNSVNKPLDPRISRLMDLDVGPPSVQRQMSQPNTTAEVDAAVSSNDQKPKLDYRNDPRFKRKHISESNLPPETLGKRYTGQRKSSTEYSSPLGDEEKQEESAYNSYNRPRPPVKSQLPSQNTAFSESDSATNVAEISTHDILDSIQIMPPPTLEPTPMPDKNLKDIFKTIDPTASPFC